MKLSDPLKISYRTLSASKLRFFLTVLGVVIGVASVILVMAIGASAQKLVLSQIENVGSNLVAILPGASEEKGPPASALGIITTTFTNDDLKALRERRNVPHLSAITGYVSGSATAEFQSTSLESSFQGVSPDLIQIENIHIASGRFFFPEEEYDLSRVMVIGATRAKELFANRNPVGETVTLKKIPFKVIGVLEERGSATFSNPDTLIYVPLGTAQKLLLGIHYLNSARAKIDDPINIERSIADITLLLRKRHDMKDTEESDFSVRSTVAALDILTTITDVLKYFLLAIASLSLLVGGIGIMNSMLISVSQRVREVGLRKAVGAQRIHIITQFLIEASFITLVGGIIGIIFGVLIAYIASLVLVKLGYDWRFLVPLFSLGIGFFVSFIIGIIFGLYPAIKASRISPMEALRYE
ncbi:MAG: multidrug ABC transporter substrate-binding protein [Candidatus Moranbacteria bacterium CG_4_10_14_3_um_filter_45_9]|nr:MAG: multidrug ABC transporter substrate-binding protein [Candidatus Moranbacteria bacterium CG_4_10_14_3_um_filter_45_9]PJA85094.1 MAG: multidrug ABC transporter substrate-binding protein [Candidatus Moranbacteria bacterium CG_4_9_14_3_um_filter_45_14]